METFRAVVRGSVQGVNFRYATAVRARKLGLRGFVRNLAGGGEVEVVVEGAREDLESLLQFLHTGPPAARVESVDVSWEAGDRGGQFETFTIRP
jgi:acylphosphatase